jgi:predicted AlkP superfamily pyrophosphatase or phosphodiesterase
MLTMVYLPHLDYSHQRHGPADVRSLEAVRSLDELIGELEQAAREAGAELVVVSEYGLERAERAVHINRELRRAGLLAARATPAGEILDPFASRAFAVSDHQIAHVYAADPRARAAAAELIGALPGVGELLDEEGKRRLGIDHDRAGDLVAVAQKGAWFTYYYWLDEQAAPDFARTVDIHRKPGYDPCELFIDPALRLPGLRVARRLAQKALGMRYLMDVIPTDAGLVQGTHGRLPDDPQDGPIFLCSRPFGSCGPEPEDGVVAMTSLSERVLSLCSAS